MGDLTIRRDCFDHRRKGETLPLEDSVPLATPCTGFDDVGGRQLSVTFSEAFVSQDWAVGCPAGARAPRIWSISGPYRIRSLAETKGENWMAKSSHIQSSPSAALAEMHPFGM